MSSSECSFNYPDHRNVTKYMLDTTLNHLHLFGDLSDKDMERIDNNSQLLSIRMGQYLFKIGELEESSYYLIEGKIEIQPEGKNPYAVYGGTDAAKHPLSTERPREHSAKAASDIKVLQMDHNILQTLSISKDDADVVELESESEETDDWMTRILQSDLITNIPTENIHLIFNSFEQLNVKKDDVVISQGDEGDYFYIIQRGRCQVTKTISTSGEILILAELGDSDCFGEEALIGNLRRNASITMLTDGVLMRLNKNNFTKLIIEPMLMHLSTSNLEALTDDQNNLLDVRSPGEYRKFSVNNATNLPLKYLRTKLNLLDPDKKYIAYCDDGKKSSIAAFLLTQLGYKASYLHGGLISHGMLEKKDIAQEVKLTNIPHNNNVNNDEKIYKIVEKMIGASKKGEDELANNLNVLLSNMYQQLQQAVEEKEAAEELLKTLQ